MYVHTHTHIYTHTHLHTHTLSLSHTYREVCLEEIRTSKNWVVWCRSRKKGNEELELLLSKDGRELFQGKCVGGEAKGDNESEEKEMRKGRTRKSKGWWRRGDVGAYQNAGNMTCWAHRELAAVDEETEKQVRSHRC